jgi:hypothetical protein
MAIPCFTDTLTLRRCSTGSYTPKEPFGTSSSLFLVVILIVLVIIIYIFIFSVSPRICSLVYSAGADRRRCWGGK